MQNFQDTSETYKGSFYQCFDNLHDCYFKSNHLVYIALIWNESRISADCQQIFFPSDHCGGGRFLLLTFFLLEDRKERRWNADTTC